MKANTIIKSICVFCGAKSGADPAYQEAAAKFATSLANNGITLIYGGGKVGMMGTIADAALAANGKVIGVIPEFLVEKELAHTEVTELHTVFTMHQRKALMTNLADAFVMLPGGIGTLEEFFEVWSWRELKFHSKPIGILNINRYFDGLIKLLNSAEQEKFLPYATTSNLIISNDPHLLIENIISTFAEEIY